MTNNTIVKAGQTVADIAIQMCGTQESLFAVALLNGVGITDALTPGSQIEGGTLAVFDVADYFRKYKLYPASGYAQSEILTPQGIDYWAIGIDFVVS